MGIGQLSIGGMFGQWENKFLIEAENTYASGKLFWLVFASTDTPDPDPE